MSSSNEISRASNVVRAASSKAIALIDVIVHERPHRYCSSSCDTKRVDRLHEILPHIRNHASHGRGHAGIARHDGAGDADLGQHGPGMQRAAPPPKGMKTNRLGSKPTFDTDQSDRACHARVGDTQNGLGSFDRGQVQAAAPTWVSIA